MDADIYKPPQAQLADQPAEPGSLTIAVVVGVVVDLIGTLVIGVVLSISLGVYLASQGNSPEEIQHALENLSPTSPVSLLAGALGCLVSVGAGYWCAAISRRRDYRAPVIMAAIMTVVGFFLGGEHAPWVHAIMAALSAASVLAGAWLYVRRLKAA